MRPSEYPTLKEKHLVTIRRTGKAEEILITVDRGEKEQHEKPLEYCQQLEDEIKAFQTEIDARTLLVTDIKQAP